MRVPFPGLCCRWPARRNGTTYTGSAPSVVGGRGPRTDGRSRRGVQAFGPFGATGVALRSPKLSMREAGEVAVSPASVNFAVPVIAGRDAILLGKG
jgi:hypothetical protein